MRVLNFEEILYHNLLRGQMSKKISTGFFSKKNDSLRPNLLKRNQWLRNSLQQPIISRIQDLINILRSDTCTKQIPRPLSIVRLNKYTLSQFDTPAPLTNGRHLRFSGANVVNLFIEKPRQ